MLGDPKVCTCPYPKWTANSFCVISAERCGGGRPGSGAVVPPGGPKLAGIAEPNLASVPRCGQLVAVPPAQRPRLVTRLLRPPTTR